MKIAKNCGKRLQIVKMLSSSLRTDSTDFHLNRIL